MENREWMMDDDRYVLPDRVTFHSAVFSGCNASELISFLIFWFMFWSILLGFLAFASGMGIIVIAPVLLCTFLCFFATAFGMRQLRNDRPPGAVGQMIVIGLDRMGFMPCRYIVDPGTLTASRSSQVVRMKAQLIDRLEPEERSSFYDVDPDFDIEK